MSLIAVLALVAALVAVAPVAVRLLGRAAGWPLAGGLLVAAGALVQQYPGGGRVTDSAAWIPSIDVALRLRLDGLSFLFALVVLVIGAAVLVYSTAYLTETRPATFYTLMTAFAAAMLLLVLADDLVVLFVAWELTTLCSYLLILTSGPRAGPPATRTLLVTAAGGLCLLGAVGLVVVRTGTTELTAALASPVWGQDPTFAGAVAVLVALAAMTKSAQFPFHAWLPDAMVAPAPVSAYLHAAAMVKAGIFLLMLFADAASSSPLWSPLLITVGLLTSVMGAAFALQRTDLKELLAYSTVSQLGLVVAVIGVGSTGAMLAASVHVVAHALFKSAAFMHVGLLERRVGTRDIRELSGMARTMPWDAAMITLAAVSMAGVPITLGFVSKELILDYMLQAPAGPGVGWLVAGVAAGGALLTFAYSARLLVTTLPGPAVEVRPWRETAPMSLGIGVGALGGLVAGLLVWLLDDLVAPAAAVASGSRLSEVSELSLWHGVNAPLLLSATVIAGGAVLVLRRDAVDRLLDRSLFPGTGVGAVEAVQSGIVAGGRRVADLTRTDAPAFHLAIPITLIGAGGVGVAFLWPGLPDTTGVRLLDLGLLAVLLLGVATVVRARTRLTGMIAAGVAGFAVALWYFELGAADVALTQLLVEILTVVIMVLVLRRMPSGFARVPRRRTVLASLAAIAAGITATVTTLAFTGQRDLSRAGRYFLDEAENETGGTNVVNTILVDFRALDTLGELVVLGIGAVAVAALLTARRPVEGPEESVPETALSEPRRNAVFLSVLDRYLVPLMLVGSVYALLRGHNAPGGGFIGALIGVSALGLAYLAAPSDDTERLAKPYLAIAGSGIVVAVGSGLVGLLEGSYLRPVKLDLGLTEISTSLVFDIGVYLAVFGVILAALNLLGTSRHQAPVESGVRGARSARRAAERAGR
ncbi:putative monovalent cation/H+ antiporter subunit A [Aeromicrobium marinum DSM 15272]|uniref:Monovalent cation/H+ antiporter subunit A n=1 Tax=Aeromicrobium marinum DSM 15272 TaxID=585531 RepID=E2SFZ8_9ACTN|nr:DUF4040 family protein [Aeromicrobium marinum]EFQ81945.1 putative monovalent cation/H+ antiporter subunit A [Aeromicrobium marinum DSM 15272]